MNCGPRIIVTALMVFVCTSCYPLCLESQAQNRAYPERVLRIENCDDYQRCINSCAELVESFGTGEVTREEAQSRLAIISKEIPAIIVRELKVSPQSVSKFSVENQVHGKLRESIYMWALYNTMLRTRASGGPPMDSRVHQEIRAKENSLKGACPNIVIPEIR